MATDCCEVKLEYGPYEDTITVYCESEWTDEQVIAKAWSVSGTIQSLRMVNQRARVVKRETVEE